VHIAELSRLWRLSRETVRQIVKNDPGVLKVRQGLTGTKTRYSVPASVAS
jgi:hypothetical protein